MASNYIGGSQPGLITADLLAHIPELEEDSGSRPTRLGLD